MATAAKPRTAAARAFSRVLLKLSGEALMGETEFGLDAPTVNELARDGFLPQDVQDSDTMMGKLEGARHPSLGV